jgi:putative hemolysin
VVVIITFLTIIFGELVPKRMGQMYPESVARLVAKPMNCGCPPPCPSSHCWPMSTEGMLRLLGVRGDRHRSVTEEEIAASLEEGLDAGVIERTSTRWCATCSAWTSARSAP